MEFTLVNFGLYFDLGFHNFIFEVIAAIGVGFIMLSFMSKLSWKTIAIIGLVIIFCHNLTSLIPFAQDSKTMAILSPLFSPAGFVLGKSTLIIGYPPIPWLGIMLVGYAAGRYFEVDSARRKKPSPVQDSLPWPYL
ncbi:heparan-alpha-glucosaminide N-acetyltransferase domain-containing protein [Paraflavitalea speifideaquila]|uniref:heparan-alpha-glucosaminide N-acetyltransferase domain-containing protein n=1 Tax=Paraflavitalea speifideaquila TaxID=3076558 RepID=UPI0028E3C130|nr:heparan-alpha-glucosaminide N-acetyltransferase domain-containing protein [Paraflavitalea speifideiaquila]